MNTLVRGVELGVIAIYFIDSMMHHQDQWISSLFMESSGLEACFSVIVSAALMAKLGNFYILDNPNVTFLINIINFSSSQ